MFSFAGYIRVGWWMGFDGMALKGADGFPEIEG